MTNSGFGTPHSLESTSDLVERAKLGEREALDRLFTRQLPALRRWARGRLPRRMRDLQDTEDLIQDTAIKAIRRLGSFVSRHPGALQAYLRQAVANRIRDEIRRSVRSPEIHELNDLKRRRRVASRRSHRRRGPRALRSGVVTPASGGS